MLNLTTEIKIWLDGPNLDTAVRDAIKTVADGIVEHLKLTGISIDDITSATNTNAAFHKFAYGSLLTSLTPFDQSWLTNLFLTYSQNCATKFPRSAFEKLFRCETGTNLYWTKQFGKWCFAGLGLTLLRLHAKSVVTLPSTFDWPVQRTNQPLDSLAKVLCEPHELLSFIRTLDIPKPAASKSNHSSFGRAAEQQRRAEWLGTRGTKVILALGWRCPEDMKIEDCLLLNRSYKSTVALHALVGTLTTVLDVLKNKYGERAPFDGGYWRTQHRQWRGAIGLNTVARDISDSHLRLKSVEPEAFADFLHTLLNAPQRFGNFEKFKSSLEAVQDKEQKEKFQVWLGLIRVYFDKVRYEDENAIKNLLGVFGLYLFYYLPGWFHTHPNSVLKFPTTPELLQPAVFVSSWMDSSEDLPLTFIKFAEARRSALQLRASTHNAILSATNQFFSFLENNSHRMEGCENFKNHLSRYDFARSKRPQVTNKSPIPRKLFVPFLQYLWSIKTYFDFVNELIIDRKLTGTDIDRLCGKTSIVNTIALSTTTVPFVPVVFFRNQCIPVKEIAYMPTGLWYETRDGSNLKLLCPHALNQILCALYTGLRHNHIQWLDARTFDSEVKEHDGAFTRLLVNTDKVKQTSWTPQVNFEVIEILKSQRAWRNAIADKHFANLHNYNNNVRSLYDPILPLFSYGPSGAPHNDTYYYRAWFDLLSSFQGYCLDLLGPNTQLPILTTLKPSQGRTDVLNSDSGPVSEQFDGDLNVFPRTKLVPKSNITPHSSRVSVVTHTLSFLTAEYTGKFITGQTPALVHYYYKPDPEEFQEKLVHQRLFLRDQALKKSALSTICEKEPALNQIQTDLNSKLARSLRQNIEGTIVDFGCISLRMQEDQTSGLEILRQRGAIGLAFNKTEICPFENNCPNDIVEFLRGTRRCSLCPAAIRSVDHLPAILARKKQSLETLIILDKKLQITPGEKPKLSETDLDVIEAERQQVAEDLAGWEAIEQLLDAQLSRINTMQDARRWLVAEPAMITEGLRRTEVPTRGTNYLLTRLAECITYPGFQSEHFRSLIDIARRRILASLDGIETALSAEIPVHPAEECAGLIRSLIEAHNLSTDEVVNLLDNPGAFVSLGARTIHGIEYGTKLNHT